MKFIALVEEALKDDSIKQSSILGTISTNSGLYPTAKTGTSAGNIAASLRSTSVGATSFTSFSTNFASTGQVSNSRAFDASNAGEDITTTKKKKDKVPSLKDCFKNNTSFSQKLFRKFKPSKNPQDAEGQNAFQ